MVSTPVANTDVGSTGTVSNAIVSTAAACTIIKVRTAVIELLLYSKYCFYKNCCCKYFSCEYCFWKNCCCQYILLYCTADAGKEVLLRIIRKARR